MSARPVYVESSALLRVLLEGDTALGASLEDAPRRVASALTILEAGRGIIRRRRDGHLTPAVARTAERQLALFERSADLLDINSEVLRLARQEFPEEPVRSLDAIHLASLRLFDEDLRGGLDIATCDARVRSNAVAMGFTVLP